MAYIGKQPGTGVRNRFLYTATAGQTTFTTSDSNLALSYSDALYMDVYLNGVLLDPANDYTATSGTSVVLGSGATAGDVLEIVVYDVFSVFNNTIDGNFDVAGNTTLDNNATVGGDLTISDKIIHSGDTNTAIRFPAADTVTVETAGSERMRVTSTGNIQIGSTNSGVAGSLDVSIGSTSSSGGITLFSPADGTHSIGFADGTTGTDRYRGYVEYQHSNDALAFATGSSERMRIDSSGNVGIGLTSPTKTLDVRGQQLVSGDGNYRATNSGALNVSPNGNLAIGIGGDSDASYYAMIFHNSSNTPVGSIFCNGSSTTYATSSDHRLKENVSDLTGAIDRVKTLAPKRFNFTADPDTTVDGFLAHEVTAVPEAIVGTHNQVDDDGNPVYQGIDQAKLVPLLTAALQEVIAKNEALELRVAALEAE